MSYCLLFDSDGTLVDSEAINTEALADELRLHGIEEDKTELLQRYRGWQFKALLDELSKKHLVELDDTFANSFRARAGKYFEERLEPIAHIHNALQQLHHVKCVASNAPMNKLKLVLKKTGLTDIFQDNLFSAYDLDRFKPDPTLFLHAASQMEFTPDKCIVVEDSDVGVQAAINANMKCVHYVPNDHETSEGSNTSFAENQHVLNIADMRHLPKAVAELEQRA